ncbi:formate dehydrogenase subunit gamma [Corticibacter populi]|uniref:Formate dehydrogenase subunit gamma n=1 Tax=Corticibacter populi TaxID=1550736 RepID=A0A3M6QIZ0_9BURK|nr:formate dehydrogenase subunit gamma [Corticibacter populi]RMX03050.1 formate dehydrogenase subunit gamma [Corticibacter populi]RZS33488.1 formate dehydrogenase subunit gamma [Corticibacter populi]
MSSKKDRILRTKLPERLCHWAIVFCFFLAATSGISWFFPTFSWLSAFLGTPQMARVLHPFFGIAVFAGLCFMFVRFVKYNLPAKTDGIWFRNVKGVILNNHAQPLRIGKYNAGQKVLFWLIMLSIVVLLASGLIMWRAYFAEFFPIPVLRLAILAHSIAGIGLILLILGHIYLAIWVRGSITGMATGYVSRAWVRQHHDRWAEELDAQEAKARGSKA